MTTTTRIRLTERAREWATSRLAIPALNSTYNRRRILPMLRDLLESQYLEPAALQALQLARLKKTLGQARDYVPFYEQRFRRAGLIPEDIESPADLACLPPLTREDIAERAADLIDVRHRQNFDRIVESPRRGDPVPLARWRRHRLVRGSTSGSTGRPTVFFEDGSTTALSWAHEFRVRHWFGLSAGASEARLIFNPLELQPNSLQNRMRRQLWNQLILAGKNLAERHHAINFEQLNRFQPRILWGLTSGLVGLADYLADRSLKLRRRPDLITTWAEPLLEHDRQRLAEVFECPVGNLYGCQELGHLAALCPQGTLHTNQENFYLETIASEDSPSESNLLATALWPSPMPFIRYQTGDLGTLSTANCSCGRTLKILDDVGGRTHDVHQLPDGRRIVTNFWTALFARNPLCQAVRRFQIVYRRDGVVEIHIVPNERYGETEESHLRQEIENKYGYPYRIELCERLQRTASGKQPLIVHQR